MASHRQINKPKNFQTHDRRMRNMATDLIIYEKIITTEAMGKELSRHMDKLITLAKKDNLAAKRKAIGYLNNTQVDENKKVHHKLFDVFPKRYARREGGYTRVLKVNTRKGDGATEVIVTFV